MDSTQFPPPASSSESRLESGVTAGAPPSPPSSASPSLPATGDGAPSASSSSSEEEKEFWPSREAVQSCVSPVRVVTKESVDPRSGEVEETPVIKACGSSSCPACRERKRRNLVAHYTQRFWSATGLRFLTFTLDKTALQRKGIDSEEKARAYLRRVWSAFLARLRRRCGGVRYYRVFDRDEGDGWHVHAVLSCPLPERTIRLQWFESGGGCVLDARSMDTPSQVADQQGREQAERELARALGYCVHKPLHVPGSTGRASQGDGYGSKEAKERRRRAASDSSSSPPGAAGSARRRGDGAGEGSGAGSLDTNSKTQRTPSPPPPVSCPEKVVDSRKEAEDALRRALQRRAGTWIRLRDGGTARLLHVGESAHILPRGEMHARAVPFSHICARTPRIERLIPMPSPSHSGNHDSESRSLDEIMPMERFREIQESMRTAEYVGEDEDGHRCRWTFDREAGTVHKERLDQ